jgi:hypothetical protein
LRSVLLAVPYTELVPENRRIPEVIYLPTYSLAMFAISLVSTIHALKQGCTRFPIQHTSLYVYSSPVTAIPYTERLCLTSHIKHKYYTG